MAFDRTVHHTVKTREGAKEGRTTPYLQLNSTEGTIIIQNGQYLTDGGEVVDEADLPEWVGEAVKGLSQETCEGLGIPFTGEPPRKPTAKRSAPVDIHAAEKGNPPMQLNAEGPDGEASDKAEKVPQNLRSAQEIKKSSDPADAPTQPGVKVSKVDPSLVKKG